MNNNNIYGNPYGQPQLTPEQIQEQQRMAAQQAAAQRENLKAIIKEVIAEMAEEVEKEYVKAQNGEIAEKNELLLEIKELNDKLDNKLEKLNQAASTSGGLNPDKIATLALLNRLKSPYNIGHYPGVPFRRF